LATTLGETAGGSASEAGAARSRHRWTSLWLEAGAKVSVVAPLGSRSYALTNAGWVGPPPPARDVSTATAYWWPAFMGKAKVSVPVETATPPDMEALPQREGVPIKWQPGNNS